MRRREFIAGLGGAAAWPLVARAQQASVKLVRIGVLADRYWAPMEALRQRLRDLGYIEGEKFRFEYRWAEGSNDRYPGLARELVSLPVDAIVTYGTPATLAAQRATTSVPIVFEAGDPVGLASWQILPIRAATLPGLPRWPPNWSRNASGCSKNYYHNSQLWACLQTVQIQLLPSA